MQSTTSLYPLDHEVSAMGIGICETIDAQDLLAAALVCALCCLAVVTTIWDW